jgi:hypothetical protein
MKMQAQHHQHNHQPLSSKYDNIRPMKIAFIINI